MNNATTASIILAGEHKTDKPGNEDTAQNQHPSNNTQVVHPSERKIEKIFEESEHAVESIWHYPIISIDKNQVTIGNLCIAILLFFIGLCYFNKIKVKIRNYLHRKFSDDKDAANAIENLLTYFLLIVFVTITLQIANIPLSTFAFVGGALAIGVGLGAQNMINNFISSLIIMIERPVKIGDIIEINTVSGKVISIGARCITIQTSRMTDVLVPNSTLIQENLINWSLMDSYIKNYVDIKFYKNGFCKLGKESNGLSFDPEDYKKINNLSTSHKNPEEVMEKIKNMFITIPELTSHIMPEVYFLGADNFYYTYTVSFTYDSKEITSLYQIKSKINNMLSKYFNIEDLVIEYN